MSVVLGFSPLSADKNVIYLALIELLLRTHSRLTSWAAGRDQRYRPQGMRPKAAVVVVDVTMVKARVGVEAVRRVLQCSPSAL